MVMRDQMLFITMFIFYRELFGFYLHVTTNIWPVSSAIRRHWETSGKAASCPPVTQSKQEAHK